MGMLDKDGEWITFLQGGQTADGTSIGQIRTMAENSSGTELQNYIAVKVDKNGAKSYEVGDPSAFRTAINAATADHTHSYLPLSGGTLTGDLTISKSTPLYILKSTSVDLSKTNNGISSIFYPGLSITDSAGRIAVRLEEVAKSDGGNGFNLYARQYNTSGTQTAQLGISGNIAQGATEMTYTVSSPANFRSAISAQAAGNYATYESGMNAIFGNVTQSTQAWAVGAKCINTTNTTMNNHFSSLIVSNAYVGLWDSTSSTSRWVAYTTAHPQPASA